MNDGFAWWLVVLGIAIGVGLSWLVLGRLPRADADVDEDERAVEAAWISRTIADYGGAAPAALVEEVLDLHRHYLQGPALDSDAGDVHDLDDVIDESEWVVEAPRNDAHREPEESEPVDREVRDPR